MHASNPRGLYLFKFKWKLKCLSKESEVSLTWDEHDKKDKIKKENKWTWMCYKFHLGRGSVLFYLYEQWHNIKPN